MNITIFNKRLHEINRGVELTHFHLEYDRTFSIRGRIQFDDALEDLLKLLNEDRDYSKLVGPVWHIAHRIVQFNTLYRRIENVRRKILTNSPKPFFVNKIRYKILPELNGRIQQLRSFIGSLDRLPFSEGKERARFHEEIKEELQIGNIKQLGCVEREYFHLVGQHLDPEKLTKIDSGAYSGSMEIYSLESWKRILTRFMTEGDDDDKRVGARLLAMIEKAIPLALKTAFAFYLPQVEKHSSNEQEEMAYYTDLVEAYRLNSPTSSSQFLRRYQLANNCRIPVEVLINEMAWDIVTRIFHLQEEEAALFLLGTRSHVIAIQVLREKSINPTVVKTYQYKIFNTGTSVGRYHELAWDEGHARPLIYHHIPSHLLSYQFAAELVRLFCYEKNVPAFYRYHDTIFLSEKRVKKDITSGTLYGLQDFGICSYLATERWIESYLTENQCKKLERVKLGEATAKQEQMVKMLQRESRQTGGKSIEKRKEGEMTPSSPIKKSLKLEESQLLLQLGLESLMQMTLPNN